MTAAVGRNPLQYSIVYILTLVASVYVGVFVSAILYDVIAGNGLNIAQRSDLVMDWIMYSIANFGSAIVVILLLRLALDTIGNSTHRSHLIVYCWTFAIAFVVGPFGLAVTVYFGAADPQPFLGLFAKTIKWGLGPALVS